MKMNRITAIFLILVLKFVIQYSFKNICKSQTNVSERCFNIVFNIIPIIAQVNTGVCFNIFSDLLDRKI